ncbi:CD3324 family protein [Clostridium sp. Marseille-P2415]|uniref:CD3324 family protein n=1 Tax=Clostridium sp. Marseille-P2415 TaxID=1805471 RepID=UPI000988895B|nr:CD3324 family protein [Clostridium sp. Marseille-P2415]
MRYKKANEILPVELVEFIQNYIDGEYIYIPRKQENKRTWGEGTGAREERELRDLAIYRDYASGICVKMLAERYYLSEKSIQRIVLQEKRKKKIE